MEDLPVAAGIDNGGRSAAEKARLLLGWIKCKESKMAREVRKQRKKDCKVEADALIAFFVQEVGEGDEFWQRLAHEANADDCSEAEFWRDVVSSVEVKSRLRCIPEQPDKFS